MHNKPLKYKKHLDQKNLILSWPSNAILQYRITTLFNKLHGINPVFPGNRCDLIWPAGDTADIVFFGDMDEILNKAKYWPYYKNIRLWVLCLDFKKKLAAVFPKIHIGVIPRYLLFSLGTPTPFPAWAHEPWTLVCATSLRPEKNIDAVFRLFNILKNDFKFPVSLSFRVPHSSPENKISFFKKHVDLSNVDYKECLFYNWHKGLIKNPVLINLSLSPHEDFGVSIAQAQELGWPLILSDWMAHKDVVGPQIIRLAPRLVKKMCSQSDTLIKNEVKQTFMKSRSSLKLSKSKTPTLDSFGLSKPLIYETFIAKIKTQQKD